ncbi:serine/threonine-protein kinase [Roseimaritima sediminicola]|uniref:serine/threonine-protein kinase n=1 Tax=Roseimaritima sediminicola TaxID=2662066 RepID=UPI00129849FE|nr:serine/threonine-protein kinase [Roseimaritima sediminicola]
MNSPDNQPGDAARSVREGGSGAVDLTGCLMGDYQLLRRLGRGGMADVYVAQQKSLGRQVAIKVLRSDLANDANYVERFRREARAVAKLSHANIVQVYEIGQHQSHYFIVQEFVDGLNLREKLERQGTLSVPEAVKVLAGVTDALDAAHEAGVTHRDIKPENIMLSRRDEVKVADFGLARVLGGEPLKDLTQVGLTMGTPRYMSPEQVQGKPVDTRSDLYSLGVTMFHLLCGRPPFEADDPLAMAVKHLHERPPDLAQARSGNDLPAWLVTTIHRLLEKDPAHRPQTPHELADEIRSGITQQSPSLAGSAATSLSAAMRLQSVMERQKMRGKHRRIKTAALWLLPLVGLLAGGAWAARRPAATVDTLLAADGVEVERLPTAAAQYLEAARLDRPQAWRAVWTFHPPEHSETNADYAVKAKLQLARLYGRRDQHLSAIDSLGDFVDDGEVPLLYRMLGQALMLESYEHSGQTKAAGRLRTELQKNYQQLSDTNPTHLELFHRKAPHLIVQRLRPS